MADILNFDNFRNKKKDIAFTQLSQTVVSAAQAVLSTNSPTFTVTQLLGTIQRSPEAALLLIEALKHLNYNFYMDVVTDPRFGTILTAITDYLSKSVELRKKLEEAESKRGDGYNPTTDDDNKPA